MKFRSRKDFFFKILIFGFIGLFLTLIISQVFFEKNYNFYLPSIFYLLACVLLIWLYFGTRYKLTATHFKYRSGPLWGKIEIASIKEIIVGKTLWVGLKPAIAKNGLIIKYGIYDEIYISPVTNDAFVNKILELNSDIKIVDKRKPTSEERN